MVVIKSGDVIRAFFTQISQIRTKAVDLKELNLFQELLIYKEQELLTTELFPSPRDKRRAQRRAFKSSEQ